MKSKKKSKRKQNSQLESLKGFQYNISWHINRTGEIKSVKAFAYCHDGNTCFIRFCIHFKYHNKNCFDFKRLSRCM